MLHTELQLASFVSDAIKNFICKSKAVRISKYGVNVLDVCGVVDYSRNRDGREGNLRSSILISVFAKDKCPFDRPLAYGVAVRAG